MLKVNNKDTRATSLACSSVLIDNFEHVIAGWVPLKFPYFILAKINTCKKQTLSINEKFPLEGI